MKVAILGAGPAGLACAIECEKLGIDAVLIERSISVGWMWPSVNYWPNMYYNHFGVKGAREYLKQYYGVDFTVLNDTKSILMKSPGKQVDITGTLGLTISRGKFQNSLENQLVHKLGKIPVYYNYLGDYKALSKEYDYVVVATGKETEARDMGLWQNESRVYIIGSTVAGNFDINSSTIYFNTEYAGTGYARLTPFNSHIAVIGLYLIGMPEFKAQELYYKFIKMEKLDSVDCFNLIMPPAFTIGKVTSFQKNNVFLVGRAAGLVDNVIGIGGVEAMISGTMAARAIKEKKDYNNMVKPLQTHIENISAFRKVIDKFTNTDFDKLITILGTPGIKHIIYNTKIDMVGKIGSILKALQATKQ